MRKPRLHSPSSTKGGQAILTAFIVVTLVSVAAANLPDSPLRRLLDTFAQPYRNLVGLNQGWDVFAPNPPRQSRFFEAVLAHEDGSATKWRFPRGAPALDAVWDDRWRKLAENQGETPGLWEQTASWLARREFERGRPVRAVTLIAWWRDLKPPGVKPETGQWQSNVYYVWRPPSRRPRG
jgi:hypothetical protein